MTALSQRERADPARGVGEGPRSSPAVPHPTNGDDGGHRVPALSMSEQDGEQEDYLWGV